MDDYYKLLTLEFEIKKEFNTTTIGSILYII